MGYLAAGVALMLQTAVGAAQTSDTAAAGAAKTITADAIAQHLGATPTANYIAEQFQKFGLRPGTSTWVQDYPIASSRLTLNAAASRIYCTATPRKGGGDTVMTTATFASGAYSALDTLVESEGIRAIAAESVVVVTGRQTPATVADAGLQGRVVVYLPAPGVDSATEQAVIRQLYAGNLVLVLSRADSATFARRQQAAAARPLWLVDPAHPANAPNEMAHWAAYVWPGAMRQCLEQAGVSLDPARADTAPTVRELPGVAVWSVPRPGQVSPELKAGTNVVGILPGTRPAGVAYDDAAALEKMLVITASMDRAAPGDGDTARAGANDNAAGVATLLALAQAFGHLPPSERPPCSIVFLATSGGDRFWGSRAWLDANRSDLAVVANVDLDLRGRPAGDSVWIDGLHDVDWPVRADWISALYPELRVTIVDGGSIARPVSDHFAFVQHAIPSLHVYDGPDATPAAARPLAAGRDTARLAEVAKLLFHLIDQLGNETMQPPWTAIGREHRLGLGTPSRP